MHDYKNDLSFTWFSAFHLRLFFLLAYNLQLHHLNMFSLNFIKQYFRKVLENLSHLFYELYY